MDLIIEAEVVLISVVEVMVIVGEVEIVAEIVVMVEIMVMVEEITITIINQILSALNVKKLVTMQENAGVI